MVDATPVQAARASMFRHISEGNLPQVQQLLAQSPHLLSQAFPFDSSLRAFTPLTLAIQNGHAHIVAALLAALGGFGESEGYIGHNSHAMVAVRNGRQQCVQVLLDAIPAAVQYEPGLEILRAAAEHGSA